METTISRCREAGFAHISLHASVYGRPLYEELGFTPTKRNAIETPVAHAEGRREGNAGFAPRYFVARHLCPDARRESKGERLRHRLGRLYPRLPSSRATIKLGNRGRNP